jgi:D-alanine-D-alanine ligase-like ATP-grasp enzyme
MKKIFRYARRFNAVKRTLMNSVYTTTITKAAQKRGIRIIVHDPVLPIFELSFGGKSVRCYNGLTDHTGAATFHLAQDKGAANRFLHDHGFHVPAQQGYIDFKQALSFLEQQEQIVVKPVSQWGGRGVSTHVSSRSELTGALAFAKRYSDEILLEECVHGVDWRLIYVDYQFVTAIERTPAHITGDGLNTIKKLIKRKNARAGKTDPSNIVPIDKETLRAVKSLGFTYESIPASGQKIQVRRTSNYHTGGTVDIIGDRVGADIVALGESIARLFKIPVLGVDILVDESGHHHIIELSPDLAISPPEGDIVVEKFLSFLFPDSHNPHASGTRRSAPDNNIPIQAHETEVVTKA